mmetsp:Transcript_9225/g.37722  ORF Transcript_9225/g.37722 Transcript_9225/m.37722 type:complete len:328 (-) Transcript_9225:30-1013(-)
MDVVGVGLVGGAVADEGGHLDEGGAGIGLGLVDRIADGVEVGVTVLDVLDVPAVRLVAGADILGEGDVGVAVDGDGVVIVEGDELAESPVGGEGGALTGHTLHVAAVTHDGVGVVVDDLAVGLVEAAREVLLGHGEADGVADAHTEGTGGDLNAVGDEVLGVTGGHGVPLAEVLEVVVRDGGVAGEVHEGVVEHAAVARGEHEAVAVEPLVVLGVVGHGLAENHVAHGRAAHGKTGVAGVGLVDGVDRKEANGVDAVHDGLGRDIRGRGDGLSAGHRLDSAGGDLSGDLPRGGLVEALTGEGGVERSHRGGGHGSHLLRFWIKGGSG